MKILVIAAQNSLSAPSEIEQAIGKKDPNLSVKADYYSPGQNILENGIINQAEIIFVNFGAPDQEKFIFGNKEKFPQAKILVGVGGVFDFLTGKLYRAPQWMRSIGLEWLWRLMQEPKRIRRIWSAVVVFPIRSILERD